MKFFLCGKYFVVVFNDNFVDIYFTEQRYKLLGTCRGSFSFIIYIDWFIDSNYLQINSGVAERFFFKMLGVLSVCLDKNC